MNTKSAGIAACLALGYALSLAWPVVAQEATNTPPVEAAEDPAHEKLRELREELEGKVNGQQWPQLTEMLTENVVVTWLDGTQSHGRKEVLEYLNDKTGGDSPLVEKFTLSIEVAALSDLYRDDAAIAYGTANSAFVLRGKELVINGPWTATMVRDGDAWKIASAHASLGAFDNPLLKWTGRMIWIAGGLAGALGMILGWWIGRRRARAASPTNA